jgi:hypothetical protein
VSDKDGADAVFIVFEVRSVREKVVDTGCLFFGYELEAGIKYEDVVVRLKGDHVAADLLDTAEGHNSYNVFGDGCGRIVGAAGF